MADVVLMVMAITIREHVCVDRKDQSYISFRHMRAFYKNCRFQFKWSKMPFREGFSKYIFPHKIVIINVANIWGVPVIYLEQAHIYDAYMLQYMNWAMSTLLDAAIVLGAGPPVICVRHRVCHTLCHSACHSVPPCATVCQPPGASTIIWQTRANIQTPPSVNPVVTSPLLLGTSPIL